MSLKQTVTVFACCYLLDNSSTQRGRVRCKTVDCVVVNIHASKAEGRRSKPPSTRKVVVVLLRYPAGLCQALFREPKTVVLFDRFETLRISPRSCEHSATEDLGCNSTKNINTLFSVFPRSHIRFKY